MKVLLLYFSGTGNTAWISRKLALEFETKGHTCDLLPLENILLGKTSPQWTDYQLFGIGFPVHAFDAPRLLFDFVRLLPPGRHDYFLYKTAANASGNGGSTRRLRHEIARRGWIIRHEAVYEMPPNMGGTVNPEKLQSRTKLAAEQVQIAVSQILNEDRLLLPDHAWMRFIGLINRLECMGLPRLSKAWKASSACIKCGKCAEQCPTANISLDEGGLRFSDQCVFCLRCWWNCPTRALQNPFFKPFQLKEPYNLED